MKLLLFFACVLFLFCAREQAAAQPRCSFSIPVSLECANPAGDAIVLGRVVNLTHINPQTGEQSESESLGNDQAGTAVVAVEELLKGSASETFEFAVRSGCIGSLDKGKRYIFNMFKSSNGYSTHGWSYIDHMSEDDKFKFLSMLRGLIKGERLSSLYGTVREQRSFNPIEGITIVAEKDDVKFEVLTDATGRYEFNPLPEGEYKVYPLLSAALRPAEDGRVQHARPGDTALVHKDLVCGIRLDFLASYTGAISGRVHGPDGNPFAAIGAVLYRYEGDSRSLYREYVRQLEPGAFSFVDLQPGRYLIIVNIPGKPGHSPGFFYPGVVYEKDAQIIDLTEGQQVTGLILKLPPPRNP